MSQKLYAFWKYDLFPGFLGGAVESIVEDGSVEIDGMGGYKFCPLTILPYEEGMRIERALRQLKYEYNTQANNLRAEFEEKVQSEIPFPIPRSPTTAPPPH